jgi:hypothetical protein
MDDARLVEKVARDFLDWHGAEAVKVPREKAEQASGEGDSVSNRRGVILPMTSWRRLPIA